MIAVRRALYIRVLATIHAVAAIAAVPVAHADLLLNPAEWHPRDRCAAEAGPQQASHASPDWEVLASPPLAEMATPRDTIVVPTEFNFNITLMLYRKHGRISHYAARVRHRGEIAHRRDAPTHKLRPVYCQTCSKSKG
jgi:hypothetical protein